MLKIRLNKSSLGLPNWLTFDTCNIPNTRINNAILSNSHLAVDCWLLRELTSEPTPEQVFHSLDLQVEECKKEEDYEMAVEC